MSAAFSPRELALIAGVVSSCSLVYELAIASAFVALTGDEVLWQTLTIGLYLAAAGAGAWRLSRTPLRDPWTLFFRVELGLAAAGALCVPGIFSIDALYRIWYRFYEGSAIRSPVPLLLTLALCHGFTALAGTLSGFELPLLLRLSKEAAPAGRGRAERLLGMNYLGALAGSLAFSFLLLPGFGPTGAALAASLANLGVCLRLLRRGAVAPSARPKRSLALAACGFAAACLAVKPLEGFRALNDYSAELGIWKEAWRGAGSSRRPPLLNVIRAVLERRGEVERLRSRYQTIDLVADSGEPSRLQRRYNRRLDEERSLPHGLALFLDRRYQFHGAVEPLYHEHMAHVPVQLFGRVPAEALVLGGGDGLLLRELLKYGDRLRSVTLVELDPMMIRLARNDPRLRALNGRSLDDPKVRTVIADAFFFVRNERRSYDAVYIDFPYPYNYGLTRLYSVEFLRGVARLIRPGGFGIMDYPLEQEDGKKAAENSGLYRPNSVVVNTLRAAGCRTVIPFVTDGPEPVPRHLARLLAPGSFAGDDPEVERLAERVELLRFKRRHPGLPLPPGEDLIVLDASAWSEGMLAFSPERRTPDFGFKDLGIRLYSLNPYRLKVLEGGRFPYSEDPRLVNSIFRPVLFKPLRLARAGEE